AATIENGTDAIDIVGTGGDMANTFNISTTTSFVVAGAGVKVAKHGNRSVSSKSGSADVLEQLGVNISLTPEQAAACLDQCGICFLFAQKFHGSMKFAAPSRREVGVRTVFNILGPLANPALTNYIVLGVYDEALMEPMAKVLMNLGIKGAMIVHGNDGLDEVTISSHTTVCEIQENKLIKYEITPEDYHIPIVDLNEVIGGTAEENAKITLAVLNGKQGPQRDIVVMNAACALYTAGKASSLAEGIRLAQESIDSGNALEKLEELKQVTAQYL
ncbi:MAG: anthranilate phosphoribosyltransferase, partial [Acutalibacteraceae bacterium]|nr:anthranilate phosphoribosyltransferase [Acutalibacteraceae bacterium]